MLDSIGEKKAKLVECLPDDLAALRASHPSVRILPVVYYQPAVVRYHVAVKVASVRARSLKTAAAKAIVKGAARGAAAKDAANAPAPLPSITITIVSSADGKPLAKAMVSAFTDFASRTGDGGTTNSRGQVSLSLGAASKQVERLYVYPASTYWPVLQENITIKSGTKIEASPIDVGYTDCVRFFYGGDDLTFGEGVTVGIVDSGVALNHADLIVNGGLNTVTGEQPTDFGDNGGEGHGTHVAGIVASRGAPPTGIRGVAPGVTLRSYRSSAKMPQAPPTLPSPKLSTPL